MSDRDIATLLADLRRGDRRAPDQFAPLVYGEFRRLDASYAKHETARRSGLC